MRRRRHQPLARRIFHWFGVSIVASIVLVMLVMWALDRVWPSPWSNDVGRVRRYVSRTFEPVWDDPVKREAAARAIAEDFDVSVRLDDAGQRPLTQIGEACPHRYAYRLPLGDESAPFGWIEVCAPKRYGPFGMIKILIGLLVMGMGLWWSSLKIARRITKPLADVAAVADGIGRGDLRRRVGHAKNRTSEVRVLSSAIDEMAERILRQLNDQRELLAAVSHELRTPLGHLRVLIELASGRKDDGPKLDKALTEMEAEIVEIDRLVGELLASSKLDFGTKNARILDARDVAIRALERNALDTLLLTAPTGVNFTADAGLVARALANLLDNAARHGGGVIRMVVRETPDRVLFEVEDRGPGVAPADTTRIFQPLQRGENGGVGSLGLGLALVARIAEAHGGSASVENPSDGGARFVLAFPR